jgi:hypothetical protein
VSAFVTPAAGRAGTVALSLLLLTTLADSCSDGSAQCRPICENTCQAFATCNLGTADAPTCVADCVAGSDPSICVRARPTDQLTCAELEAVYDCAQYCTTLCRRAPSCGTFSETLCDTGCASYGPPVCNAASVAARTCDQLKPELRTYEDRGRALTRPGSVSEGGTGNPATFGLCRDARDCAAPLGCTGATNTCAPCTANEECAQGVLKYVCSSSAECVQVDCLTGADCSTVFPACDPTTFKCVDCLRDEDCNDPSSLSAGKKCDVSNKTCVQCLTGSDCSAPTPRCDLSYHLCLP